MPIPRNVETLTALNVYFAATREGGNEVGIEDQTLFESKNCRFPMAQAKVGCFFAVVVAMFCEKKA